VTFLSLQCRLHSLASKVLSLNITFTFIEAMLAARWRAHCHRWLHNQCQISDNTAASLISRPRPAIDVDGVGLLQNSRTTPTSPPQHLVWSVVDADTEAGTRSKCSARWNVGSADVEVFKRSIRNPRGISDTALHSLTDPTHPQRIS